MKQIVEMIMVVGLVGLGATKAQAESSFHTSVRVESNGQVYTYESSRPENMHWQSPDGRIRVDVKTFRQQQWEYYQQMRAKMKEMERKIREEIRRMRSW